MPTKRMTKKQRELLKKAEGLILKIEANKANYKELDEVVIKLLDTNFIESKKFKLIDNFLDKEGNAKNTVFKPAGVKRFELKKVS